MDDTPRDAECPLVQPGVPSRDTTGLYCRLPNGRVRVPEQEERLRYCLPGEFDACPVYLRHARNA
jgi:hypothetical protein